MRRASVATLLFPFAFALFLRIAYGQGTDGRCKTTTADRTPSGQVTFAGPPYQITGDGLGAYENNTSNVRIAVTTPALFKLNPPSTSTPRSVFINLDNPVPGDVGVRRGVAHASIVEMLAQWRVVADTEHSVLDIPIGSTVDADQLSIVFYFDGVPYGLQMGPAPHGLCDTTGTAFYGTGTTRATIRRVTARQYEVDLPVGSIGRLFDGRLGMAQVVNKGLYYTSIHSRIEK